MTTSTPYNGTSGWSGSDASEQRAIERDASGATGALQQQVVNYVAATTTSGATIKDVRAAFPEDHHGTLSGALSVLHKDGRIARLLAKRDRCSLYVMPEFTAGRETAPHGRPRKSVLSEREQYALDAVKAKVEFSSGLGVAMTTARPAYHAAGLGLIERLRR